MIWRLGLIALALTSTVIYFTHERGSTAGDAQEIRALVQDYYAALRGGRFEEAAACYRRDAFAGSGLDPAVALRAAMMLGPLDEQPTLEALRIDGGRATGEVVIQRKPQGPVGAEMQTLDGQRVGTWARTLHFVREDAHWKIDAAGDNALGIEAEKALEVLNGLRQQRAFGGAGSPLPTQPQ